MPAVSPLAALESRRVRVAGVVADAARVTGVDFAYLMGQAGIESSFNPTARARTSSATGLYQFIDQSWLGVVERHGADHGLGWAAAAIERGANGRFRVADPATRQAILNLRNDPAIAARMAAEHASDNRTYLEARTGRTAAPVDLDLAHFLGPGGAVRFLRAAAATPAASAADLMPRAAAANRGVFYDRSGRARSLTQVRELFARRLERHAGTADGAALAATPADGAPSTARTVQPADWLRLSRTIAQRGEGAGRLSAGVDLAPEHARLAWRMMGAHSL